MRTTAPDPVASPSDPPGPSLYRKLRPGPGLKRQQVNASQRTRIHRAMVELAAERGHEHVTVRALTRTAGISTRTFYAHFSNIDDCFAATYEAVTARVTDRVLAAHASGGGEVGRDGGVAAQVEALMNEFATRPKSARFFLIEPYTTGDETRAIVERAEDRLGRALLVGPSDSPARRLATGFAPRAVAAGVTRVARTRLMLDRAGELPGLAPELTVWILAFRSRLSESPHRHATARSRSGKSTEVPVLGPVGDEAACILTATARIAATHGFASLSVPTVLREAGVSRRRFEARFRGIPECFREAVESLTRTAVGGTVRDVLAAGADHPLGRATTAVCLELARNAALTRLLFVEVPAAGRAGLTTREELISEATIEAGRLTSEQLGAKQVQTEASIAAAWQVLDAEVGRGRAGHLAALAPVASVLG